MRVCHEGVSAEALSVKILVIGGTRFIGPRVVQRLVAGGHQVAVFHRGMHQTPLPSQVVEITDRRAGMPVVEFPQEVRALRPEVVIHMMAMGSQDAAAARESFAGIAQRIVMLSSGDVYRAYGYFCGIESGPCEPTPLTEDSPLRTGLFPYRKPETAPGQLEYFYDKILAEREIAADPALPATILRLPKVYGPGDNADLATVYGFRNRPGWRWTHGHVDNVAAAIVLAATHERATGRIFNVGEEHTPTMSERLAYLPPRPEAPLLDGEHRFEQNVDYDTSRIRQELGFREVIAERAAMLAVVQASLGSGAAAS
jgi:nucleoside-diphosphate-sugar epimerase